MNNVIFISWEKHQRTRTICAKLGIALHEKISIYHGIKRYLSLGIATIKTINAEKPRVLITQNPSVILCLLALALRPFYKYRLFIDAHNEAVIPYIHNKAPFRFIARYLARKADLIIVTNSILAQTVTSYGGRPIIFPDLLPIAKHETQQDTLSAKNSFQITLISTYAPDEPYHNVFEAFRTIPGNVEMFVTGKIPQYLDSSAIDSRIHLTGYLSDHEYEQLLQNSDLIIDLTTMENCLVCGAYEALSIEKPMILSKDQVNDELFPCAVLTKNDAPSIAAAIQSAITDIQAIKTRTAHYKVTFSEKEKKNLSHFIEIIRNA